MAQSSLEVESRPHVSPQHTGHQRPDQSRNGIKESPRVAPTFVADEVRVEGDEGIVLLDGALYEQRRRALALVEPGIGINAARLLQVLDDEGAVAEPLIAVNDERNLCLRSLARIGCVHGLIGYPSHAQPCLKLAAERANVGNAEHPRELEQLDGILLRVCHGLTSRAAQAAKAASRRGSMSLAVSRRNSR